MNIRIFIIAILCINISNAQTCNGLLKSKLEQYYLNVNNKPDSLAYITCNFIQNRLNAKEIFMDFIETTVNGQPVYFVYIISKSPDPVLFEIPLLGKKEMVGINSKAVERGVNVLSLNNYYLSHENLLAYIEPFLEDVNTLYYSTSGDLNLVNFKSLKDKKNKYLFEKLNLIRLHTAASFISTKKDFLLGKKVNALIIGGVDYNCGNQKDLPKNKLWNYLPGTKDETDAVASILKKIGTVTVLDSCKVGESDFIYQINNNKYDILHIATHGFYIEGTFPAIGVYDKTFMLNRSGIVLSGANHKGASVEYFNSLGLFTALEFLNVNLSNVKLIVLSTCHSGEGQSIQSGAPLGLILGLLREGSNGLIVSNKAIDDDDSKVFMSALYNKIIQYRNVDQAFIDTIRTLCKKYPQKEWDFFDLIH